MRTQPFAAQALVSALLVAPFLVLEWVNRRATQRDFPVALFLVMSLHALLIVRLLTPARRHLREERRLGALKAGHWAGLSLAVLLGYALCRSDFRPASLLPGRVELRLIV